MSPGVRHLPELLSVTCITLVHGDIHGDYGTMTCHMREIFGLPAILTNINIIKLDKICKKKINIFMTDLILFS